MHEARTRASTKVFFLDPNEFEQKGSEAKWRWWDMYPKLGSDTGPNPEHVEILKKTLASDSPQLWNEWRTAHPSEQPQLSGMEFPTSIVDGQPTGVRLAGLDLRGADMHGVQLHYAELDRLLLDRADLRESLIMQSKVLRSSLNLANLTQVCFGSTTIASCEFTGADMLRTVMMNGALGGCDFESALLEDADLSSSHFEKCSFRLARLGGAHCGSSEFLNCDFSAADLRRASMVKSKFTDCDFSRARVYGTNAWDVDLSEDTVQLDLIVTGQSGDGEVKVDDLRVAQFIDLILTNPRISEVIQTIGSKGVLLLGRFTEDRKPVLEALRTGLRRRGYIPIVFDLPEEKNRDEIEMLTTLAGFSLFMIADLTTLRSVPLELDALAPNIMIPIVPVIQEDDPLSAIEPLKNRFDWVLEPLVYDTTDNLMIGLEAGAIEPALDKHQQLLARRAAKLKKRRVRDVIVKRSGA